MTNPPGPDEPDAQPDHTPYQPPAPQYGPPPEYPPPPQYTPPPQSGPPPQPYGQPQWTPPVPQPQYGQPQYGQPQYGQPQYGPPQYGQEQPYSLMPPPPPPAKRRGKLLAAVIAAVVVAGGGVATVVALSDAGGKSGAGSPRAAVENIVSDINDSDVIGMLDSLAPAERVAMADPLIKDFAELKRTHVLSSDADLSHLAGAAANFSGLTYGSDITINDHVQVVQITGGTLHIDTDLSKLPLSDDFLKTIGLSHGLSGSNSETIDIAQQIRENHGETIRVATEKVAGRWYPSLLYTIAYYAVEASGLPQPTAADAVPATGAGTPVEAVRQLVDALLGGDVRAAIGLASPTELAALHDYGGVILNRIGGGYAPAPVHLERLELHSVPGSDGTQMVVIDGFTILVGGPVGEINMEIDGDCVRLTLGGRTKRMCASQVADQIGKLFKQVTGKSMTDAQRRALTDLSGTTNLQSGIVTSQVDGKWFVNPIQTIFGATTTALERFQGNDLLELIGLFKQLFAVSHSASASGGGVFCVPAPSQNC